MGLAQDLLGAHSPGNRFVYYPSAKKWNNGVLPSLKEINPQGRGHLYLHIPYCKSLCTFCGCNIKIDQNEAEHFTYIESLIKELELKDPHGITRHSISALTLGGGSPNAINPLALEKLITFLTGYFPQLDEVLIEVDPLVLNKEQVELFRTLTSNARNLRFSMGVQDFDSRICENLNRNQNIDHIFNAFELIGTKHEKGIDLIWGLPLQTKETIASWDQQVGKLGPDWINYYPLAKVPWLAPYQEAYGNFDLPELEEKYEFFEIGHLLFESHTFKHFGFGHYLKPGSSLYKAWQAESIFRSVSGLYTNKQDYSLGIGVGAISDFENFYHQNERVLQKFKHSILEKSNATGFRTHEKSDFDKDFQSLSQDILVKNKVALPQLSKEFYDSLDPSWLKDETPASSLNGLQTIEISPKGRFFIKNILQLLEKTQLK